MSKAESKVWLLWFMIISLNVYHRDAGDFPANVILAFPEQLDPPG
jgi:hypothetical protein